MQCLGAELFPIKFKGHSELTDHSQTQNTVDMVTGHSVTSNSKYVSFFLFLF